MIFNCVNYKDDYFNFIELVVEYFRRCRKEDSYN